MDVLEITFANCVDFSFWNECYGVKEMSNEVENGAVAAQAEGAQRPVVQPVQVHVKDEDAIACYANFCRVTGSPEELIVDFGLNPQPIGVPKDPIHVKQRIIMNYFTAKRLLAALNMSIHRHEQVFGVLETDVQKRLRNQ